MRKTSSFLGYSQRHVSFDTSGTNYWHTHIAFHSWIICQATWNPKTPGKSSQCSHFQTMATRSVAAAFFLYSFWMSAWIYCVPSICFRVLLHCQLSTKPTMMTDDYDPKIYKIMTVSACEASMFVSTLSIEHITKLPHFTWTQTPHFP